MRFCGIVSYPQNFNHTHHYDFNGAICRGMEAQMLAADPLVGDDQMIPPNDIGTLEDGDGGYGSIR